MADRAQTINLGCGTLILIAIIVAIFSNSGSRDVDSLRNDVRELKKSIEAQSRQIRDLHDMLKKREPAPKAVEAMPKKPVELDEPQKKPLP
jgi:cell division protein FtsL